MKLNIPKVNFYIATFITILFIALGMNTLHQAKLQYKRTSARIQLAVFLDVNSTVSLDVVRERLVNLNGVKELEYFTPERALEKALKETPEIKDVLVGGDNPFPPYFLVTPKHKDPASVGYLKEAVSAMNGVEEVRFDIILVSIADKLNRFITFYVGAIKAILYICLLLALAKVGWAVYRRTADYKRYIFLALSGIITSVIASAFYLLAVGIAHTPLAPMPFKYVAFLIPVGVLLSFIWDN